MVSNAKRGKDFEQRCADRVRQLGLNLIVKRIQRSSFYHSEPDLEFVDFDFKADCKFTITEFTKLEKENLYKTVKKKYHKTIVIIGERRTKNQLSFDNVKVLRRSKFGIIEIAYDDFLRYLDSVKLKGIYNA